MRTDLPCFRFSALVGFVLSLTAEAQERLSPESAKLLHERQTLGKTVWEPEQVAQSYEAAVTRLWDRLRAAPDSTAAANVFKAIEYNS